ncbi:hypothetical protein BSL82_15260 [Tardibacter chloracetimidivorans]|uniref:Glycine zipper domain-containing protein n=2 Tax=Tardibacter chloracetimidivorans TaxID=1921510 RepID=A0A1L3ZXX1_9SPHN|nr:hypothetical protein BSL82_15260 [Tardibacter chloracetimidivorans]
MPRTIFAVFGTAGAALLMASPAIAGDAGDILKGGAIGAAGGAVVGAVVPGISTGEGALIGGAGGAVIGALDRDGRRWYRDERGNRYWVDKRGRRHYKR